MSEIIKTAAALFVITLVAAIFLAFVYDITKEPIASQRQNVRDIAMREISPAASNFEPLEFPGQFKDKITSLYFGINDGETVGYIIGVSPRGYSGKIDMLIGIDTDGVITGVKIVQHTETPGLGARVTNEEFIGQYTGRSGFLSIVKIPSEENEIQAITAATITGNAVTQGVNDALEFFKQHLAEDVDRE